MFFAEVNPIRIAFVAFFSVLALLWALADAGTIAAANAFIAWRNVAVQGLGVMTIGAMSAAVLLATRPRWLEQRLRGLDKMYRLHKWLGIAALTFGTMHWLAAKGPKWLVQAGLIARQPRAPRTGQLAGGGDALAGLQGFLQSQRGFAEQIGQIAFYAVAALIVIALVRRFPYRHFFKTHRLLALAYLALAWHAFALLRFENWSQPLGFAVGALLAGGIVSAFTVLLGRVGTGRRVVGVVESVERHDGVAVSAITVKLQGRWPGHAAGQFAFVTFDRREGAHPFTIASAWADDGRLFFLVKALGD